jgi:hypothetical protein
MVHTQKILSTKRSSLCDKEVFYFVSLLSDIFLYQIQFQVIEEVWKKWEIINYYLLICYWLDV